MDINLNTDYKRDLKASGRLFVPEVATLAAATAAGMAAKNIFFCLADGKYYITKVGGSFKEFGVDGSGVPLPSQTGKTNQFLSTDGTNPKWGPVTGWAIQGNAGTDPATHFLGTLDNKPLLFRCNNINRFRLNVDGSADFGQLGGAVSDIVFNLSANGISFFKVGSGAYGGFLTFETDASAATGFSFRNSQNTAWIPLIASQVNTKIVQSGLDNQYEALMIQSSILSNNEESTTFSNKHGSGGGKRLIIYGLNGHVSILPTTGNLIVGDYYTGDVASSKFTVLSTSQGALPAPRMTSAQRTAIAAPAEGLEVYDLTLHKKMFYNGSAWEQINSTVI